ncbi:alpha/beta hydrolase-fold protein [Amycolatopsis lurida]
MLLAGGSALGVAGVAAAGATGVLPFSEAMQRALGVASSNPATELGVTRVERVYSAARGREVDLVLMLPSKNPQRGLPISLYLHGRGGSGRRSAPGGLVNQLSGEVARRVIPAYGFLAVDGGPNNYWHEAVPGDDPMRMLLEEVPVWLAQRGLGGADGVPFACAGTSMGGFGALLYARRRAQQRRPPAAVAAVSPALITSWAEMSKRNAFRDAADWASMDPLKHLGDIQGIPTGVWCGTEDAFIGGVRQFIAEAKPKVGHTARGKHGEAFFRSVVPGLVSFLGKHAPAPARPA